MREPIAITIVSLLSISTITNLIISVPPSLAQIETVNDESPHGYENLDKMLEQESYTQTVFTDLEEINGTKELAISPLQSIQSIQIEKRGREGVTVST